MIGLMFLHAWHTTINISTFRTAWKSAIIKINIHSLFHGFIYKTRQFSCIISNFCHLYLIFACLYSHKISSLLIYWRKGLSVSFEETQFNFSIIPCKQSFLVPWNIFSNDRWPTATSHDFIFTTLLYFLDENSDNYFVLIELVFPCKEFWSDGKE